MIRSFPELETSTLEPIVLPLWDAGFVTDTDGEFSLYLLVHPETWEIRYVGQTRQNLKARLLGHCRDPRTKHVTSWIKSLVEVNLRPVLVEVLRASGQDSIDEQERLLIAHLRFQGCRLTNHESGGRSRYEVSTETREKLAAAQRGRTHTESAKQKMSLAKKGKPLPYTRRPLFGDENPSRRPEVMEKISRSLTGRKGPSPSLETRRKLSEAMRNRPPQRVYLGFVSPDGSVYRDVVNLKAFCRAHGLQPSCMCLVNQGKLYSHKGWTVYTEEYAVSVSSEEPAPVIEHAARPAPKIRPVS